MIFKSIVCAVCTCLIFSFQAQAFDFEEFAKKALENAKKSQATNQNNAQGKTKNHTVSKTNARSSSASNADLPKFNIRGMYLGMPMKDAMALLKNYNPPMSVTSPVGRVEDIVGSRISGPSYSIGINAQDRANPITERFSLAANTPPTNAEIVMGIARYHVIDPVLLSDMRALFIKKYGDPVFESGPDTSGMISSYILSWSLKPDGKPLKNKLVIEKCTSIWKGYEPHVTQHRTTLVQDLMGRAKVGANFQDCGFTFVVQMRPDSKHYNKNTATATYLTFLYDGNEARKSISKTIAYTEELAKQLEAKRLKKIQGAKKPQL